MKALMCGGSHHVDSGADPVHYLDPRLLTILPGFKPDLVEQQYIITFTICIALVSLYHGVCFCWSHDNSIPKRLILIQKRHPYTGNLNRETFGSTNNQVKGSMGQFASTCGRLSNVFKGGEMHFSVNQMQHQPLQGLLLPCLPVIIVPCFNIWHASFANIELGWNQS